MVLTFFCACISVVSSLLLLFLFFFFVRFTFSAFLFFRLALSDIQKKRFSLFFFLLFPFFFSLFLFTLELFYSRLFFLWCLRWRARCCEVLLPFFLVVFLGGSPLSPRGVTGCCCFACW